MKVCPKCGSEMGEDVNFCTNCGTNIQDVPVTVDEKAATPAKESETAETERPITRAEYQQQGESDASQATNFFKEKGEVDEAEVYHPANIWDWLTYSWKNPMKEQVAESWYGWATLLVEDLLFIIGMASGSSRVMGMFNSGYSMMNGMQIPYIPFFIYLLIVQAACFGVYYLGYKFIYGSVRQFNDFVNHMMQVSNLNAIFIVLAFIFMLMVNPILVGIMIFLILTVWTASFQVVLLGDPNPVHDKFYSYLVLQVIFALAFTLIFAVIGWGIVGSTLGMFGRFGM